MPKKIYRHGDIVFTKVDAIPEGKVTRTDDKLEIKGETGQSHVMTKVKVIEIDWDKVLAEVQEDSSPMTHPQHPPLQLPPGLYSVTRVRSVTPIID